MIIGLVGYKGSGKTTACNIIKKHLDDVMQINIKDALIDEIKGKFPDLLGAIVEIEQMSIDALFINKPPLIRTLMQNYGSDVRRQDDDDYWVSRWWSKVTVTYTLGATAETKPRHKNTLTDDVRFNNEADAIRNLNGILIRLERTDLKHSDTHQSETEQKEIECDYTITCGAGEFDKLESELIKILDSVE